MEDTQDEQEPTIVKATQDSTPLDENREKADKESSKQEKRRSRRKTPSNRLSAEVQLLSDERYHSFPELNVSPLASSVVLKELVCPENPGEVNFESICSTQTFSTYPWIPGRPQREGDPIADYYRVKIYKNRTILALADGCNWGMRSQEAAKRACHAFSDYIEEQQNCIKDVKDVGHYLLRAFDKASRQIVEGKDSIWDAGTTTLIGGIVVQIQDEDRWCFICVSVGDCKAFRWSHNEKQVIDLTKGNRNNLTDPRDPGGRLGPQLINGEPDLRNLRLYYTEVLEDDIVFLVSDGVHDNMDPQFLGKTPKDFNIESDSWEEAEKESPDATDDAKNNFRKDIMEKKIRHIASKHRRVRPKYITRWLIEYCKGITESSRQWMEENPTKHLPFDFIQYPGKLDHTTCVALRIGNYDETENRKAKKSRSKTKGRKERSKVNSEEAEAEVV